jgi:hypothetical protein
MGAANLALARPLARPPTKEFRVAGEISPDVRSRSLFRIGRDSHGRWVAQDERAMCGGLFVSRAAALKFALFENGGRARAVIMVPGVLELNTRGGQRTITA